MASRKVVKKIVPSARKRGRAPIKAVPAYIPEMQARRFLPKEPKVEPKISETQAQKFLRMGGAMHEALERMRKHWTRLDALTACEAWRDLSKAPEGAFYITQAEALMLKNEVNLIANVLLHGQKAREWRG